MVKLNLALNLKHLSTLKGSSVKVTSGYSGVLMIWFWISPKPRSV